jgi:alkylation response protein AidB-like acyl-CoA dehydrogenase
MVGKYNNAMIRPSNRSDWAGSPGVRRAVTDVVDRGSEQELDALVERRLQEFLSDFPPGAVTPTVFFGGRYDSGLAWTHYPAGAGGLGATPRHHRMVEETLRGLDSPDPFVGNPIGIGMVAPTIAFHGTQAQRDAHLRSLYTGEVVWCQLFSEPGAGSDLAGLATRAQYLNGGWQIDGQKVWTSLAHTAGWGLLLARTDPSVPKHRGLTCFLLNMKAPGVDVRPLRQITGEAEFNEVFLDGVHIDDSHRLGEVGDGWNVAMTTLMHERVAIGGALASRGSGPAQLLISLVTASEHVSHGLVDRTVRLWIEAELGRMMTLRSSQLAQAGIPGPVGSVNKLFSAEHNKRIYELVLDLMGPSGMLYPTSAPEDAETDRSMFRSDPRVAFLRARANTIEGGTSEVMRNILAERMLGLPREASNDRTIPWSEIPH